jgi:hypothetical protein
MIQEILVYIIIAAVVLRIGWNLYKALRTKDKSLCGSCASCGFKSEVKKKGRLAPFNVDPASDPLRAAGIRYVRQK